MPRSIGFAQRFLFILCLTSHAFADGDLPWDAFFHADGATLVADSNGQPVVFRGVNLPGLEYGQFAQNPYPGVAGTNYFVPRSEDIAQLAQWGFNSLRLPFELARLVPGYQTNAGGQVSLDPAYLSLLDKVVAETRSYRAEAQRQWPPNQGDVDRPRTPVAIPSIPFSIVLSSNIWRPT